MEFSEKKTALKAGKKSGSWSMSVFLSNLVKVAKVALIRSIPGYTSYHEGKRRMEELIRAADKN